MLILSIDTTGFSASLAAVRDGKNVLFNEVGHGFSPDKKWADFSYSLPEHHYNYLLKNFGKFFNKTRIRWGKIDAVAVSAYSGIYNCVLTGRVVAETLACCYQKKLIKVDHLLAHAYSSWIGRDPAQFRFPILVFSASGSHSDFSLISDFKSCEIIYDKVPKENIGDAEKFVGIGTLFYRIGRKLDIIPLAGQNIRKSFIKLIKIISLGDSRRFKFVSVYQGELLDFDFSDLIISVDELIAREKKRTGKLTPRFIMDVAASFQESLCEILVDKIIRLAKIKKVKEIHICGGISENKYLMQKLSAKIAKEKFNFVLRRPLKKEYRLDNAAMIGVLAYYQKKYKIKFINFKPKITE